MIPKASTLVPYLIFWKQEHLMPAHPSHLPMERRFKTVVNQTPCLSPKSGHISRWRLRSELPIKLRVVPAVKRAVEERRRTSQVVITSRALPES